MNGHIIVFISVAFTYCTTINGWAWQCNAENGYCTRILSPSVDEPEHPSLAVCKLLCGQPSYLNVWPYPTGKIASEKNLVMVDPQHITFELDGSTTTKNFLQEVVDYFQENLSRDNSNCICQDYYPLVVSLDALSDDLSLTLDTDEFYSLKLNTSDKRIRVEIVGNTIFGVRHGIETLLQLLVPYQNADSACLATLKNVQVTDKPVYRHRALLLDSARNFLSVNTIKKNINAMAASKLNVLHWHVTDSQSFPLELPSLPNMTKCGAYDKDRIYSPKDIEELVTYAKIRGVRILLEIDGPSHVGNGWQWGNEAGLGNLTVCTNQQPWRSFCIQPPCGQLNPANPNIYKVLGQLYGDISNMFPNIGMFHMGGDEVFIPCWNSSKEILDYIKGKPTTEETFLDLWGEFQNKSLRAYDAAVGNDKTSIVVWTSHLTDPNVIQKYLPKERYIIQTWVPDTNQDLITSLLNLGYKIIISTKDKWYLDHGFWGSTLYYNWRTVYNNKMYSQYHKSILGGEVCMWGELVDDSNVESRVWPRAAAAAERLWTNPSTTAGAAEGRFFSHRERLISRGLKTEAVVPQWCVQNEGECSSYL
ncbi:hypothetical protein NQ315_005950 [Exocentrus adspersus]|uniref:Beta-hexosaminidase n=1 Tax=Exocentrus adspersus TaxID=1586481 RepID=A0AAV8VB71_9CUCU|nr:hypothetical protein NQ315_005950 [Exocentrus adspersus]